MRRVLYRWKDCAAGRKGLCHILAGTYAKCTDQQLEHSKPAELGVTAQYLTAYLLEHCPEVFDDHLAKTATPLQGPKIMARLHHMYAKDASGKRVPGPEHPTRHDDLAGEWAVVSGAQTDLFRG